MTEYDQERLTALHEELDRAKEEIVCLKLELTELEKAQNEIAELHGQLRCLVAQCYEIMPYVEGEGSEREIAAFKETLAWIGGNAGKP